MSRMWSKELRSALKKHWETAKQDKDKFRLLVEADPLFKGKSWSACRQMAERLKMYKRGKLSRRYLFSQLTEQQRAKLKELLAGSEVPWAEILKEFPSFTKGQLRNFASNYGIKIQKEVGKTTKEDKKRKSLEQLKAQLEKQQRSWPDPEVIQMTEEAWNYPGVRRGYISRVDYKGPGYRSGIAILDLHKAAEQGCRFNVLDGGLVSKPYVRYELSKRLRGCGSNLKDAIVEHFIDEAAKELASVLPKIQKPKSIWRDPQKPEYTRLYIIPSPIYDGPFSQEYNCAYGEEIARRLAELRREDIRLYNSGNDRVEVKGVNEIDGVINPSRNRIPGRYYSQAAEKEIEDQVGQSDDDFPSQRLVGCFAASVLKPNGEKMTPYATIPASSRLVATTVGENQEGMLIVESRPWDEQILKLFSFWNFKDIIHRERQLVTGIKDGASQIHRDIVEMIKLKKARTVGLLADDLNINREVIEEAIKFLEEKKGSSRKTWPGLHYDPTSQRYDFYFDWFQERLRYALPTEKFVLDSFLFFGCLHAGYTTTDYEHFVTKYPKILFDFDIRNLVGLGDFIAGLAHQLMHRGEIIGAMNNTDMEIFAAELIATVMLETFKMRLERDLAIWVKEKGRTPNVGEAMEICRRALAKFVYIIGNHDDWQMRDGNTPLITFRDKLGQILVREIEKSVVAAGLPIFDFRKFVDEKLFIPPEQRPIYLLPSGLELGMRHPGMARAETTSLRAQKALDTLGTQIVAIANFHVTCVVHKWRPDLGQCVAVQAPTQVIHTPFEGSKLKKLDFGPMYLKVYSHEKRIYRTDLAYFNKPILQVPLVKWTDVDALKTRFKLYRA